VDSDLPFLQRARNVLRSGITCYFEQPLAGGLARLGVSPNVATLLGLLLAGAAAYFAANGRFPLAGLLVFAAALFDLIDGALARRAGLVTKRGAFLDSNADRVSESAVLLGLAVHFVQPGTADRTATILCFVALAGSLMVSYVRARAEGLGLGGDLKFEGFFTRAERVVIVAVGLATGQPVIALWVLAVGTPLSALQRFWSIWRT
jgi:CDP-diacylglycerol--glycerol-3-phosphate 3-phosphatidyltransferase